jgi:DNA-binding MarR family transcriptional regulator
MRKLIVDQLARRVHRVHVAKLNENLAPLHLDAVMFGMLDAIHQNPNIKQRDAAWLRRMDVVTASKLVDQLVFKKWVRRRMDPKDRRSWRLELTVKGEHILERAELIGLSVEKQMLSSLTERDILTLEELLSRVICTNDGYDRPGVDRRKRQKKTPRQDRSIVSDPPSR